MSTTSPEPSSSRGRGRGRGRSRGGHGKYLRARGRRGGGRPAEWKTRLVLEDGEGVELDPDSTEAKEFEQKYSKRRLESNVDRYVEPEPELNSEGEVEAEPEVDLSAFLARQRLSPGTKPSSAPPPPAEDEGIDPAVAQMNLDPSDSQSKSRKGKVQQIAWDENLEQLSRDKAVADANRDLRDRFRVQAEKQRFKPLATKDRGQEKSYVDAPPLPTDEQKAPRNQKEDLQGFLDDLLN